MSEYCTHNGKRIHATAHDAVKAIKRLSRNASESGRPYRCEHCGGWHHGRRNVEQYKWQKHKGKIRREGPKD